MIPISDDNPTRRKPYVVYALVALNVLVYLVDHASARGPLSALWDYSMVPYSVIHDTPVKVPVGRNPYGQVLVATHLGLNPQWLTIFTSMFMHASLMHIGGNMLYLWIFGNNIEDVLGHTKFLLFYLASGVLAALAHVYSDVNSVIPTVGASGAIAGVLGAYLIVYPHARVNTVVILGFFWDLVQIPAVFVLGVWFLLQLTGVLGTGGQIGGGVAYWAHVGGFVAGAVMILLLGGRGLARRRRSYLSRYDEERPYPWRRW